MATGRTDSDRVFRAAVRHSRIVRLLRTVIPLGVLLGIVAVVVITTWFDPLRALAKLPVSIGNLAVSGTKITMQHPKIAGYTRDERPYNVTARAAHQDIKNPDVLELEDVNATMQLQDKGSLKISARTGVYDSKSEKLVLRQNIVVTSADYEALLSELVVNVRSGHLVSEQPIEVKMLQGIVNANRMEVFESGNIIVFEQGVTVQLYGIAVASDSGTQQP